MSAACYHFLLRTVFTGSTPPDWPEKDTHRIASEKMSDGHVKIKWEDKLEHNTHHDDSEQKKVESSIIMEKVSKMNGNTFLQAEARAIREAHEQLPDEVNNDLTMSLPAGNYD